MVLVAAPTWMFTRWLAAYWAVRYELRSVPARDEIADAGHLLMHERFANRTSLSMCRACDMEQPTHDDPRLESLVFTGIFWIDPFRARMGEVAHEKARQLIELTGFFLVAGIGFEPMTFRL